MVAYSTMMFSLIGIAFSFDGFQGIKTYLNFTIFGSIGLIIIFRILQNVNIESINNFLSKIDQQNQFEMIV